MASLAAPPATSAPVEAALIPAARRHTRVDWNELQAVALQVQQALDEHGADAHDEYATVWDMWCDLLKDAKATDATTATDSDATTSELDERAPGWYASAHEYWEDETNCPLSDNGVLGGYAHVSPADVQGSETFFTRMSKLRPSWKRDAAVDCGAGIGRVSKFLLLPHFAAVDLVEQSPRLLQSVPQYVGRHNVDDIRRIRSLYCMGLQDFDPAPATYDLIWVQWVSSHLTDADFVRFLQRCKRALRPHGWIGVKENTLLGGEPYELDREDSSITRSTVYYVSLFKQAGLKILAKERQQHFPQELHPVTMYALA